MKTLLVTGADGFIGTHVVRRLAATGDCRLVAVARRQTGKTPTGVERVLADLGSPSQTVELIGRWQPDVVIHAAGGRGRSDDDEWNNVRISRSLLDAIAAKAPNARTILFGSAAEYGETGNTKVHETAECRPGTTYGRTKLAITDEALALTRDGKLRATVLRPFNVIGPGISATLAAASFLQQVRQRRMRDGAYLVTMGARDAVRDFVAVDDLVTAIEKVMQRDLPGEIINVCTGEGRTLDWLLTRMATLGGAKVTFEVDAKHVAAGQPSISIGDPSKGQRLLGFTPSPDLDASLRAMWNGAMAAQANEQP